MIIRIVIVLRKIFLRVIDLVVFDVWVVGVCWLFFI